MWFWRHLWRHCDVQWRRTAKKVTALESVDQDHWFDILLDMDKRSLKFSKSLTLLGLIQGQGQRSRSRSHTKLLSTCYHMNLTWRLYDNYNRSYGQLCDFDVIYDVIVTSSDVVRPKKLYLWNQWAKTFDLIYYSTRLEKVWYFSKLWPDQTFQGQGQSQGHIWRALSNPITYF